MTIATDCVAAPTEALRLQSPRSDFELASRVIVGQHLPSPELITAYCSADLSRRFQDPLVVAPAIGIR